MRCGAQVLGCVWLCSLAFGVNDVFAQPQTQNVEVEPVTCWWRTAVSSIRVGQAFTVILTCSALETEAAKAVIDRSRLAPAAVQLPPYEVMSGVQSDDITTAARRFMQYEYTLRLISDDAFGADLPVPSLQVSYGIESKVQQDASVQGREQTYILPPLPVHVASLVPSTETHIREAPVPTAAAISARQTRGALLRTTGTIIFALAGLVLLLSIVRAFQQRKSAVTRVRTNLVGDAAILNSVSRELRAVQQEAMRETWNDQLAARALAALRVTASYATGLPVTQIRIRQGENCASQLVLKRPLGGRVLVSGAATTSDVPESIDGSTDDLRSAIAQFTSARYGRSTSPLDLNASIESAIRATKRVAAQHTWMAQSAAAVRRSVGGWRERAWER